MAKKFMYVCVGILALAVAFLLGARYGEAGYADHTATGIVACNGPMVLLDNGEAWNWEGAGGVYAWQLVQSYGNLPVPVSQIRFWEGYLVITTDNDAWWYNDGQWMHIGPPPGGLATQPSTWGSIKAQFKE